MNRVVFPCGNAMIGSMLCTERSILAYNQDYLLGRVTKDYAEATDLYIDDVIFGTARVGVAAAPTVAPTPHALRLQGEFEGLDLTDA